MSTKEIKTLSDALNAEIATTQKRKYAWVLFAFVAIANGFTSGLMGFPDLNAIASVDGIASTSFPLVERIFMMTASCLMMLPFFQQLFKSNVYQNYHQRSLNRMQEIRKNSKLGKELEKSQRQGLLLWADCFCIVIISSIIAYTITAAIIHSAINIPSIALLLVGVLLVHRIATHLIKRKIKNASNKINLNKKHEQMVLAFASRKRTENIIKQAIHKLKLLQFVKPTDEQLIDALKREIYPVQLERYRSQVNQKMWLHSSIYYLKSKYDKNDPYHKFILNNIHKLDRFIAASPLLKFEIEMQKGKDADKKVIYQSLQHFRQWAIDNKQIIKKDTACETLLTEFLQKHSADISDEFSKKAIIAEIEEEKSFKSWNPDLEHLETEVQLQAMKNRMIARSDAETARLEETADHNSSWFKFAHFGNVLGVINALVNAAITGAVSGKIILFILPIVFGISITNPIIISAIVGAACIAGFSSSFLITRQSIIKVFKKIDDYKMRRRLIANPIKKEAMPWWLTPLVALSAIGLGVLSGIQVYYILMIYMPSIAVPAGIFVGAISVVAVFSLFLDYTSALVDKHKKTQAFLQEHFPEEAKKSQVTSAIYRNEIIVSLVVSIAIGVLLWQSFPLHIVMVSMVSLASFCATWLFIGTTSNDLYQKDGINTLNLTSKLGFGVTLLYCFCLMVAVTSGINALPFFTGNIMGTIAAGSIGLMVAGLYFIYVWNTATAPHNNRQESIINTQTTEAKQNAPLLSRLPNLISFVIFSVLFVSVWWSSITLLPPFYATLLAIMISVPTGYMINKDILNIAQVYKEVAVQGDMRPVEEPGNTVQAEIVQEPPVTQSITQPETLPSPQEDQGEATQEENWLLRWASNICSG